MSTILYCTKCHWQGEHLDGRQYDDGSVDQWCPKCESTDDTKINEFDSEELITLAKKAGWSWNGNAYVNGDLICRKWQDLPIEEIITPIDRKTE